MVNHAKLIQKKKALPLCGSKDIAFDKIEIFKEKKKKFISNSII